MTIKSEWTCHRFHFMGLSEHVTDTYYLQHSNMWRFCYTSPSYTNSNVSTISLHSESHNACQPVEVLKIFLPI